MKGIITKIKKIWCITTKKGKSYPITNDSIYYGGFGIYKGREVEFELEAILVMKKPENPGTDNKSIDKLIKETSKKKR